MSKDIDAIRLEKARVFVSAVQAKKPGITDPAKIIELMENGDMTLNDAKVVLLWLLSTEKDFIATPHALLSSALLLLDTRWSDGSAPTLKQQFVRQVTNDRISKIDEVLSTLSVPELKMALQHIQMYLEHHNVLTRITFGP